jgi:hypothetical protein
MKKQEKVTKKAADPQLSHSSKLAQIQSGGKNKRSTGGEKKNIVITGKDGSKIIQSQKEEKFEETAVLRKKRNYVMYEAKLGTETTTDITKIDAPRKKEKPVLRAPEPRVEEKIIQKKKKKEYLDNYQYHETKNIKNPNPRFQVTVEHQRLGDIIGGTFEETSYQRQVFAQGSNRPQLTEKTTTVTKTGSAAGPTLRGNKSQVTMKKTTITGSAPQTTSSKKTTTTTTTKTAQRGGPGGAGGKEKVTETSVKRRTGGTGSKTETRTESKTTTSGRGTQGGSSTTTTKTTTTRTTGGKPAESKTTQSSTTTTKTTTRTTKTSGGDGGSKTETTVTKTESKSEGGEGGASIRKKYAKGRFQVSKQ